MNKRTKKTAMTMKMAMISAFLFTLVFFIPAPAHAACTNPAGVAGEEIYNSSRNILQYCNGENWVAMVCNNEGGAAPAPCSLPWGGSILDSETVTAYQNATEPFGGSCTSETRSCSNGALSGTYANQNCSVSPPADCTPPWGGTVTHGNDVTAYQNATEPFGGSCTSETRTCNNGALSGSYSNQNCSVSPPADCFAPWGGTVNHGSNVTAYQTASVPFGNTCASQTRSCNNGTLSGSYTNQNCTVDADPCAGSPSVGDVCNDGSVYAGLSPADNAPMFAARCDVGMTWNGSVCSGSQTMLFWKTSNTSPNGATNTNDGVANTNAMESAGISLHPAAEACRLIGPDWYLPAPNELSVFYTNRLAIGGFDISGTTPNGYYWSSLGIGGGIASRIRFSNGNSDVVGMASGYAVRCARK